jgi:hypothetical protein
MKKLLVVMVLVGACAGRAHVEATPAQRAQAIQLYLDGATTQQIGQRFALSQNEARELLHDTIKDLNRMYFRNR